MISAIPILTFAAVSCSLFSVPIDQKQLPNDAATLRRMVFDSIAQLDASEARRIKTGEKPFCGDCSPQEAESAVSRSPKNNWRCSKPS